MVVRAALGLQRNHHSSGGDLHLANDGATSRHALLWPTADVRTIDQHDGNRVTEDGSEAIALAAAHVTREWRVVRRMQREEHADWLLERQDAAGRQLIAFEVSGVDTGTINARVRDKLAQVAKSTDVDIRVAGVVGFARPEAELAVVRGASRGR